VQKDLSFGFLDVVWSVEDLADLCERKNGPARRQGAEVSLQSGFWERMVGMPWVDLVEDEKSGSHYPGIVP
jgi:hypothetical protein